MLTPAERKALKAKAHRLDPVVRIGAQGLTDAVIAEIDENRVPDRSAPAIPCLAPVADSGYPNQFLLRRKLE